MATAKKPPTQVAGVEGIAPKPIVLTPEQPKQIDWQRIIGLPPFQMFAIEKEKSLLHVFTVPHGGRESRAEVKEKQLQEWLARHDPDDLYQQYCNWHKAKGCWPEETPLGNIKGR